MKSFLPVLLLFLAFDASPQTVWQKILPGNQTRQARDIAPAADGDYWVLTNYRSGLGDSTRIDLVKINLQGDVVDTKTFPSAYGMALQTFPDGSLAIVGQHQAMYSFDSKALVIKLDAQGVIQWQTQLEVGYAHAMISDQAGGYYVGGLFDNTGSSDQSFIAHLSANGAVLWNKKYSVVSQSVVQSLMLSGNSLLAVGGTTTIGAGLDGFFLLKANASNGSQQWQVTQDVGSFQVDQNISLVFPPIGVSTDGAGNILVACAGSPQYAEGSGIYRFAPADGALLQHIWLTRVGVQRYPMDLLTDVAGNAVITGGSGHYTERLRPFIEKRGSNGQVVWSQRLNFEGQLTGLAPAPDGGFIACGIDFGGSYNPNGQLVHSLIIRFDSLGNAYPCRIEGFVRSDDNLNCLSEPGDPPLRNWHLLLDDTMHLSTDADGHFRTAVPPGTHKIRLLTPSPLFEACDNDFTFTTSLNDPVATTDFLVQKGPDCALLEIGITHTDLVVCDTSVFYLSWQNRGNTTADNATATVLLDPHLTVLDASQNFLQNGQELTFALNSVAAGAKGSIRIRARLNCDAPLFGTSVIEARIAPASWCWTGTPAGWNGAFVQISGECDGGTAHFTVSNTGAAALAEPVPYDLYVDAALLESGTLLPQPGQPVTVDYPTQGRTVTLQVAQAPGYPVRSIPTATVEACGDAPYGFVSTGFPPMFDHDDAAAPWVSKVFIENKSRRTGDRIFETSQGYGRYHFMEPDTLPLEFSLRLSNSFDQPVQETNLVLVPSHQFDLSTFEVLSWSHPLTYEINNNGEIRIRATGMDLLPEEEFQFRFRLVYRPDVSEDFISIGSEAYLDGKGPLYPYEAFFNIAENFVASTISPASDDPDVQIFGRGNAVDFTIDFTQMSNGDLVQLGATTQFGEGQDVFVVRTDSTGQGIWQKNYMLGAGFHYPTTILPLPDNSVLVAGSFEDVNMEDYLNFNYAFIAHIDADGTLLWLRSWKPSTGGTVSAGALTPDGNAVFWGVGYLDDSQQWLNFMIKISPDNTVLWQKTYEDFENEGLLYGRLKSGEDGYLYYFGQPSYSPTNFDCRLIRLNWSGDVVSTKAYSNQPDTYPIINDFTPSPDGGMLLAGSVSNYDATSQAYTYNIILVKLDAQFAVEWQQLHEVPLLTDISAVEYSDGNYFLAGDMFSDSTNSLSLDVLMAKADSTGDVQWLKFFPVNSFEFSNKLLVGQHGRIWASGQTQTADNLYNLQMVLVRASDPDAPLDAGDVASGQAFVPIYPNPADKVIWPSLPEKEADGAPWMFDILDVNNESLQQGRWQPGTAIPVRNLPNGAYVLRLRKNDSTCSMGKFLIQR